MTTVPAFTKTLQAVTNVVGTSYEWAVLVQQLEASKVLVFGGRQGIKQAYARLPQVVAETVSPAVIESQAQLDSWLGELIRAVRQLPMVTVTVAYIPTAAQASELLKLTRSGFTQPVIVDLQTDAQLLAGIRIELVNRRVQVSLGEELEAVMVEQTEKGTDE